MAVRDVYASKKEVGGCTNVFLELFYRYHKFLVSLGYYEAKALGYMSHRLCDLLQRLY